MKKIGLVGIVVFMIAMLTISACKLQLYEAAAEVVVGEGGTVQLESGHTVTVPADSLEVSGTITVKEQEAVEGVDEELYKPFAKSVSLDFGEAKLKPGKSIQIDFAVGGLSRAAEEVTHGVLAYRKNSTESEYLPKKDSSADGYISVDVWFDGTFQPVEIIAEAGDVALQKPYLATWRYDVREEIDYPSYGLPEKNEFTFTDKKMNFYAEYFFENDTDVSMYIYYSDIRYEEAEKIELAGGDVYMLDIYFGVGSGFMNRESVDDDFTEPENMDLDNDIGPIALYFMDSGTVYLVPAAMIFPEEEYDDAAYQTAKEAVLNYINNDIANASGEPELISGLIAKLTKN